MIESDFGFSGSERSDRLRDAWPQVAGAELAERVSVVGVAGDELIVNAPNATWLHQVSFLEPQILRGIQAIDPEVSSLRVRCLSRGIEPSIERESIGRCR